MPQRTIITVTFVAVIAACAAAASAQPLPADCPTLPTDPNDTMPLTLATKIPPRAGMPQGGYVQFGLNNVPASGTTCIPASPRLPRDVLRGDTSDDILTGQPRPRVIIETR